MELCKPLSESQNIHFSPAPIPRHTQGPIDVILLGSPVEHVVLCLLLLSLTHMACPQGSVKCRSSRGDILTIMGAEFLATIFIGVLNACLVQPVAYIERTVFYRERAAGASPI